MMREEIMRIGDVVMGAIVGWAVIWATVLIVSETIDYLKEKL